MDKYKIYCTTDNKWEEAIASAPLTQCPVNAAHTVKADSVSIIQTDVLVRDGSHLDVTLADLKQLRINEIDLKTQSLIHNGFSYGGQTFSMSDVAQTNWIGLKQAADAGMITFPVNVSTITDGEYSLADAAALDQFYGTGLAVKKSHLDSGRDLKIQINAAVDEAGVDAVVDAR